MKREERIVDKPWARPLGAGGTPQGFSLMEFLVAMSIFLVVGGAAVALFTRHRPLYAEQQNLTRLNIGMRSAAGQLQLDIVNAATGVYPGVNVPNWPIGVTVVNNIPTGGANCYNAATNTYTASCFDVLNVISVDPNTPPLHPQDSGSNCVSSTSSATFAQPAPGDTVSQDAAHFHSGDELLLLKSDGSQLSAIVLTNDGLASGQKIQLQHNPTGSNGTNTPANDPLGMTTNATTKLGTTFCTTDWLLRLNAITYKVDATDPTNPKLTRVQGGTSSVLAEQIVGFKVGVATWNGVNTSSTAYSFDASTYGYDFTLVRSVCVSLIGRSVPSKDPSYVFRNSFDGGPYQIQGVSVVVNPRNLSMND